MEETTAGFQKEYSAYGGTSTIAVCKRSLRDKGTDIESYAVIVFSGVDLNGDAVDSVAAYNRSFTARV